MPPKAVLFDLGGTLADYYERNEWLVVLRECATAASAWLAGRGRPAAAADALARLKAQQEEEAGRLRAEDWRVYVMKDRLAWAFLPLDSAPPAGLLAGLCRAFLQPIFDRGRLLPDALEVVDALRARGLALAIVSNLPWGAPREPWVEEVRRLGLLDRIPVFVSCREVGWRKPDRRIFDLAVSRLNAAPADCLFVGDEPVWDYAGAKDAGMRTVLLDRDGRHVARGLTSIRRLTDLPSLLQSIEQE